MKEDEINIKEELRAILRFYDQRLDSCTVGESRSFANMLTEHMELDGSIKDFAQFFGVSEESVRNTIHRKMIAKPKRQVLYPFQKFLKIVPKKWRAK